jgi:hypothetical protein
LTTAEFYRFALWAANALEFGLEAVAGASIAHFAAEDRLKPELQLLPLVIFAMPSLS